MAALGWLSALPIAVIVLAMTVMRQPAWIAGLLGLAVTLALVILPTGLGPQSSHWPELFAGAGLEALFTTATIVWIVFPALCLYELQTRSGGLAKISGFLSSASTDARLQSLMVAWFFGMFMEGMAGFGTPVALAAPILVSLGMTAERAVALALIGHAAGTSFGAIGTPVFALMATTGLGGLELSRPIALLHALTCWIGAWAVYRLADRSRAASGPHWPVVAFTGFAVPYLLVAWFVGPELPTLAGAAVGGAIFVAAVLKAGDARGRPEWGVLSRAAAPYLALMGLVLASRLIPGMQASLRAVAIDWQLFDGFGGRFEPLFHPGTMLMLAFLAGGLVQRQSKTAFAASMRAAAARLPQVAMALALMLAISRLMLHTQMMTHFAGIAAASGAGWPMLSPWIGALGSFVTGSATASNILFSEFQLEAAQALSLPVPVMQAAQSLGASIGNLIAPHNIIAGGATVALAAGSEGKVMRITALVCLGYGLLAGTLITSLVWIGWFV